MPLATEQWRAVFRHVHVHQDSIDGDLPELFECFLSVARLGYAVAPIGQERCAQATQHWLVVHHQDSLHVFLTQHLHLSGGMQFEEPIPEKK